VQEGFEAVVASTNEVDKDKDGLEKTAAITEEQESLSGADCTASLSEAGRRYWGMSE